MAKPEWGAKHICHSCGTRYYDLQRSPIICPKCNTQFDPEAFLKSRRTRSAAVEEVAAPKAPAKKPAPKAAPEEPEEVAEVELETDDATVSLETLEDDAEVDEADATEADLGADVDADVEAADDDDENDSDVLLEDASELGDEDVEEVVDISKGDDPNA